jgi:glycosyltransferase involved in cell wall biosynthesis
MKISIITINYNNLKGLKKTLESVFSQNFETFEYIIIDGDSTDGSKEYLLVNSNRINYWISEPDKGVYHAMNKGLLQTSGDYVIFMNSGDIFYDDDVIYNFTKLCKGEDLIYGLTIWSHTNMYWNPPRGIRLRDTINKVLIPHQATFYKLSKIKQIGGYNENYKIVSDWIMFVDFIIHGFSYSKIELVVCLSEPAGLSLTNISIIKSEQISYLKQKKYKYLIGYFYFSFVDRLKRFFKKY